VRELGKTLSICTAIFIEVVVLPTEFDAVIDNNEDGFNTLYTQINDLLQGLQISKEDRLV
jgi:hypothetical protein